MLKLGEMKRCNKQEHVFCDKRISCDDCKTILDLEDNIQDSRNSTIKSSYLQDDEKWVMGNGSTIKFELRNLI